ncbi:hypothetical protein GOODEAATRI_009483, partial [Goodea atripinnis]
LSSCVYVRHPPSIKNGQQLDWSLSSVVSHPRICSWTILRDYVWVSPDGDGNRPRVIQPLDEARDRQSTAQPVWRLCGWKNRTNVSEENFAVAKGEHRVKISAQT